MTDEFEESDDHPRFRSLVVVTYGRSGSTLIQGMLNSSPNTLIRGENNLFVLPLFRAYQAVTDAQSGGNAYSARIKESRSAWFGAEEFVPTVMLSDLSALIERQLLGRMSCRPAMLGFKEIRWNEVPVEDWPAMITWLESVFPDLAFVVHRRNLNDVRRSGWWADSSDDHFRDVVGTVTERQDQLLELRPDTTFQTHYDDLVSRNIELLRNLASWLGFAEVDEVLQRWLRTLDLPHSTRTAT